MSIFISHFISSRDANISPLVFGPLANRGISEWYWVLCENCHAMLSLPVVICANGNRTLMKHIVSKHITFNTQYITVVFWMRSGSYFFAFSVLRINWNESRHHNGGHINPLFIYMEQKLNENQLFRCKL